MKYSVLVKPKVMLRMNGIEAASQKEAAIKAVDLYESNAQDLMQRDLRNFCRGSASGEFEYMEYADGELHIEALVDEVDDEEFSRSEWYLVCGEAEEQVIVDSHELRDELLAVIKKHMEK